VTRGGKEYIIGLPIDTPVVVVDDKMNALEMGFDKRLPSMLPTVRHPLPPSLPPLFVLSSIPLPPSLSPSPPMWKPS